MGRVLYHLLSCVLGSFRTEDTSPSSSLSPLDWWQNTLIYQVYPRSFKDTDGDGIGDLNGITEKLDYIQDLGVDTVWIQPFFKSPMDDMGYDVQDFKAVDPLFGTMEDFKRLLKGIKERGMKVILDFVVNHTSDQCEWFQLSEQGVEPYKDYYVWRDAKKFNDTHKTYPNNWSSMFHGTAWQWSEMRKQYYLHQFSVQQPDLNYRNPRVVKEMESVMRFWLDMGVDGFRLDAPKHMFESEHFLDEPDIKGTFGWPARIYTTRLPETFAQIRAWRALLDEYTAKDGQARILCTEDYEVPTMLKDYLGDAAHPGAQIPFYFLLVFSDRKTNATKLNQIIQDLVTVFPRSAWNWVTDNHDNWRVSSWFSREAVDAFNMLNLLLPGSASVYQGSELAMHDIPVRPDQRQDPLNGGPGRADSRDAHRAPMPWDSSRNAGFSKARKPWLPVHPSYWTSNVEIQENDPDSHLNTFKRIVALRKTPVVRLGDLKTYTPKDWVFMFTRSLKDETIVVLLNIGSETEDVCVKDVAPKLPDEMFVRVKSIGSLHDVGKKLRLGPGSHGSKCIEMRPQSGLVLSTSHGAAISFSLFMLLLTIVSTMIS
nr:PREDICTED: maltase 2-like [Bemisia tabaci]